MNIENEQIIAKAVRDPDHVRWLMRVALNKGPYWYDEFDATAECMEILEAFLSEAASKESVP